MPEPTPDQTLHLPSLVIKNFRGIDELTIPRLGRVTLLTGKNGVGKTTVLDAVRVWADRGVNGVFDAVLRERGDAFTGIEEGHPKVFPDRLALFTARDDAVEAIISVGPIDDPSATLQIKHIQPRVKDPYAPDPTPINDHLVELERRFGKHDPIPPSPPTLSLSVSKPTALMCNCLGPNVPTDETVEKYWNDVALTAHDDLAVEALNLVSDLLTERVAMVDSPIIDHQIHKRRLMAKVKGMDYPVPVRTLGDGAMRAFAVALSLAKSSDGFLLIDEAENGIHHSIQAKFWNMVLQTAERNNVQVIATTHSWDCVVGFAQAANELEDVEGLLVRIERPPIGLRPITYDESRLKNIAKHGIEVR